MFYSVNSERACDQIDTTVITLHLEMCNGVLGSTFGPQTRCIPHAEVNS